MTRREMEQELLSIRFVHYTPEVQSCISKIVSSERCSDVSDTVINGLWNACRNELIAILTEHGIDHQSTDNDDEDHLSIAYLEVIRSYIDNARNYEAELEDSDDNLFENLHRITFDPIVKASREARHASDLANDRWEFFNERGAEAEFDRWRNRPLSPAQIVALSFGKDPEVVTIESLGPYRRICRSPFRDAFKDRLELVEAAVSATTLSTPILLSDFIQWASTKNLDLPTELTGKVIVKSDEEAAFWKAKCEALEAEIAKLRQDIESIPAKSRISFYRLIVGMAVARFGYRTDQRSGATTAILEALDHVKLPMRADAIRDNLADAAREMEYQWTKPIRWP